MQEVPHQDQVEGVIADPNDNEDHAYRVSTRKREIPQHRGSVFKRVVHRIREGEVRHFSPFADFVLGAHEHMQIINVQVHYEKGAEKRDYIVDMEERGGQSERSGTRRYDEDMEDGTPERSRLRLFTVHVRIVFGREFAVRDDGHASTFRFIGCLVGW